MSLFKDQRIQRSNSFSEGDPAFAEKNEELKRRNSLRDIPAVTKDDKKTGKKSSEKKKQEKKDTKAVIKKNAEKVPVVKAPKKKTLREQTLEDLQKAHDDLEAVEHAVFSENYHLLRKKQYADVTKESDKEKRAEKAEERLALSMEIAKAEFERGQNPVEYTHIERDRLNEKIQAFRKLSSKPADLSNDRKFVENLSKNYRLCEAAMQMRHWLDEAAEGGFLPENDVLTEIEEKIEGFMEVKEYLDAQCDLMKSPFYAYLAKEDVTYTNDQLDELVRRSEQGSVQDYFIRLQRLRNLSFVRKKGMDSVEKKAAMNAKRQTEILTGRFQRRELKANLVKEGLEFTGSRNFSDANADPAFSEKLFKDVLADFANVKVTDLHFASLKDMTDHFKLNASYFAQARQVQRYLAQAVMNDMAPSDEEILKLRAKIRTFTDLEEYMYMLQADILYGDNADHMTDAEIAQRVTNAMKNQELNDGLFNCCIGMDMSKLEKGYLKAFRKEHRNRRAAISEAYGYTHPVQVTAETEDGKVTTTEPGKITRAELDKRAAGYQKNVALLEQLGSIHRYASNVSNTRNAVLIRTYLKSKGKNVVTYANNRVPNAYMIGKSADEIKKFLDKLELGTEQERHDAYLALYDETKKANQDDFDSSDPKIFLSGLEYKYRISNMMANLDDTAKFTTDEKLKKEIEDVDYSVGQNLASNFTSIAQGINMDLFRTLTLDDWRKSDHASIMQFNTEVAMETNQFSQQRDPKIGEKVGFTPRWRQVARGLSTLVTLATSSLVPDRMGNVHGGPAVHAYLQRKKAGLVKDMTSEEYERFKQFYHTRSKRYEQDWTKEDRRLRNLTDPPLTGVRLEVVGFMERLNGQAFTDRKDDFVKKLYQTANDSKDEKALKDKAECLEEMFRTLLEYDLSKLNFGSFLDLIRDPKRFEENHAITHFGMEMDTYTDMYEQLRNNPLAKCRLSAKMVQEVRARAELLKAAYTFYNNDIIQIMDSGIVNDSGLSIEELYHLPFEAVKKKMNEALDNEGKSEIKQSWVMLSTATASLSGFGSGVDIRQLTEKFRKAQKLGEEMSPETVVNILKGEKSVLKKKIPPVTVWLSSAHEYKSGFAEAFTEKNLTVTEREGKTRNEKSRLYQKAVNAEKVIKGRDKVRNLMAGARNKLDYRLKMQLNTGTLESLSAFMTGRADEDRKLVEQYLDPKKRDKLLDKLTRDLATYQITLHAETDEDIAKYAEGLELMSRKVNAYRSLMGENPDYEKRLQNRSEGETTTDLYRMKRHLSMMQNLSDYYRARKLLMTNTYYRLHYNDEISVNHDKNTTEEQREVADLINLVARTSSRLRGELRLSREEMEMDKLLESLEKQADQNAFVTGQPDLTKATASKIKQAHKEIRRYLKAVNPKLPPDPDDPEAETDFTMSEFDLKIKFGNGGDHPFPQGVKYETPAVRNFIQLMRYDTVMKNRHVGPNVKNPVRMRDLLDDKGKVLYDRLMEIFKYEDKDGKKTSYSSMKLEDPTEKDQKKKVVFDSAINVARITQSLIHSYGAEAPVEEIIEMSKGLLIGQRGELDLTKPEEMAYAKKIWLESYRKLFYLQYDILKKTDRTYGALINQLSYSGFMNSLGPGQVDYWRRMQYTQDLTQTIDNRTVQINGEKISPAELLVREGLIKPEEVEECQQLCKGYYQTAVYGTSGYFTNPVEFYQQDPPSVYSQPQADMRECVDRERKHKFGRSLSFAEQRKYWKELLAENDETLTGDREITDFKREQLDLYSKSEKRELKKTREKEKGTLLRYREAIEQRKDQCLGEAKQSLGGSVPDEILNKLIYLHPGMKTDGKPGEEEITAFYNAVKQYCGINVSPEEKDAKRKEAIKTLHGMTKGMLKGFESNRTSIFTEEMMDPTKAVSIKNRLYTPLLKSKALQGLQDLILLEENGGVRRLLWNEEVEGGRNLLEEIRSDQQTVLETDIIFALVESDFYQVMRDLGNKGGSISEKRFILMNDILTRLKGDRNFVMDRDLTDEEAQLLRDFGINLKLIRPLREEEPEEEKPEEKQEEVKAEKPLVFDEKLFEEDLDEEGLILDDENKQEEEPLNVIHEEKEVKDKQTNVDRMMQEQIQRNLHYELDPIQYNKNVSARDKGPHVPYENQEGKVYCWACVMSGLMNSFAGKKVSDLKKIAARPLPIPSFKDSGAPNQKTYDAGVKLIKDMYNGTAYGNPTIFGDYIQKELPNAAVRSAIIGREEGRLPYCKRRFLETLGKNLEKGPVGILFGGHFVLAYELRDEQIMVRDSLKSDSDALVPYDYTADQMFSSVGQQVELVWLENMTGQEEQLAEEFGLNYHAEQHGFSDSGDERLARKQGEATYRSVKNEQTLLHRNGIEATTQLYDDVVINSIYLPKAKMAAAGPLGGGVPNPQPGPVLEEEKKAEVPVKEEEKKEEKVPEQEEEKKEEKVSGQKEEEKKEEKKVVQRVFQPEMTPQEKEKRKKKILKDKGVGDDVELSGPLYTLANKSAVKKGAFKEEFLTEAEKFMKTVDTWSGIKRLDDSELIKKMGIRDVTDCLYVDGVPLKQFVQKRYEYDGDDVMTLRAYTAMIAGRQKYPITIARPIFTLDNDIDVVIAPLNLNATKLGEKKAKANSKAYRKASEDAMKAVTTLDRTRIIQKAKTALREKQNGANAVTVFENLMTKLYALNDITSSGLQSAIRGLDGYCSVLQDMFSSGKGYMVGMEDLNLLINRILAANSGIAYFDNEMRDKYKSRKKKKDPKDAERMELMEQLGNVLEGNEEKLRKALTHATIVTYGKLDIRKILRL